MPIPKVNQMRANFYSVELPNGAVYISYQTPIALDIYGDAGTEHIRRKQFYSVTTSKHLNQYCRGYRQVHEGEWKEWMAQALGEKSAEHIKEAADGKIKRAIQI